MPYQLSGGAPGRVHFNFTTVQPPSENYITQAEVIQLRVMNPTTDVDLRIGLRFLDLKGEVQINQIAQHFAANPAGAQVEQFVTTEGFLLSAMVRALAAQRGVCFVQMFIQRGLGGDDTSQARLLFQGYVTSTEYVGFPDSRPESSLSGRGAVRFIAGVDPPLATPATITVPAGVRWFIRQAQCTFQTAALVPQNYMLLEVFDAGGNRLYSSLLFISSTGGMNTYKFDWSVSNQYLGEATRDQARSIEAGVPAGCTIQINNDGLQPDEQISGFSVTVEEFVEF